MPRTSKIAIVGIVAVLHLWVFAALALMKPVQPEPKPMSVSFVSRPADAAVGASAAQQNQSEQASKSQAPATDKAILPAESPSPNEPAVSPDQLDMAALDQQPVDQQVLTADQASSASSAADSAAQTSPKTQPPAIVESDEQLINLDVLAAVNSTLQKQSGAQTKVDRALEQISSAKSKKPSQSDLATRAGKDDEQQRAESSGQIASKNSNPFPGIDTACPAFLHQLPAGEQFALVGNGCTLGQVQGCELKFDQVGVKNYPALDAQAGIYQGEAVLSFTVNAKGDPTEVELLAATTSGMARSALKFLSTSQFAPLKDSSRCGPYALPVRFSLYD